jgi:hypothetical protein
MDDDRWRHLRMFDHISLRARLARLEWLDDKDPPHVDIDRLQQVWDRVEASVRADAVYLLSGQADTRVVLDGWDQTKWRTATVINDRCQTAMCLAGWTAELDAADQGGVDGAWVADKSMLEAWARWANGPHAADPFYDQGVEDHDQFVALQLAGDLGEGLAPRDDDPITDIESHPVHIPDRLVRRDDLGVPVGPRVLRVNYVPARRRAKRLLGLTDSEASDLFHQDNTLEVLRRKIHTMIAAEQVRRHRRVVIGQMRAELTATPEG